MKTVVVGVAGGSGSGKTTFGRGLRGRLGPEVSGILAQDSYYRDLHLLFDGDGGRVNFDHPDSLEFELMVAPPGRAARGARRCGVPRYDFVSHSRLPDSDEFAARRVVIVDGILLLSQPAVRARLDLAIFIDTPEPVRFARRLARDVVERGRTPEGVRHQFSSAR